MGTIVLLCGGLAFFLYGMNVMSHGLEKLTNGGLERTLRKATNNKLLALIFGAGITIAIQSSSALTVMLVGLVNSGILAFGQTIGVLMGSNIGTTLTAWILSLAGIEGGAWYLEIIKPKNFAPVLALVGVAMNMVGKKQKSKSIGNVLVGFAILMYGMTMMSDSMEAYATPDSPIAPLLTAFENPFLAVLVGAIFTGVIQSSAASVAILQAFAAGGTVTFGMAIPIVMGQNIGTCVTALLSSIGVNRNAKKVAVVHLSFNIIGTLICLIPFCIFYYAVDLPFLRSNISAFQIAIVHSIFNVFTTLILLPFTKQLEKLAYVIIKDKGEQQAKLLDDRLLTVPSFAVTGAFDVTVEMCKLANKAFKKSLALLNKYDEKVAAEVSELESLIDNHEDQLGSYMVKLSKTGVSDETSKEIAKILHTIDDFERMGDHAENLVFVSREMHEKGIVFSHEANMEISKLTEALAEIMEKTCTAFEHNDVELAASVEPLEQVIDKMIAEVKSRHVVRLQKGNCTIELGFILTDLLTNFERISDHCSNVAVAIIECAHGTFDTHEYLSHVKEDGNIAFKNMYEEYKARYFF